MIVKLDNIPALKSMGIFPQLWEPESKVKAGIVLVHGLGEHSDRYKGEFAEFFTLKGIAIQTFDLPGHGRSEGKRGHVDSPQTFYEIIKIAIADLKKAVNDLPVFLYGHSLGGLIAFDYGHQYGSTIDGLICTAPVLDVFQPIKPFKKFLAKKLQQVAPAFTMDSDLEVDKLSKDKNVIEAYQNDLMVHPKTSATLAKYIIVRGEELQKTNIKPQNPGLIMVGSEERIVNKKAIVDYCDGSDKCELKIWDGLYHELHNEPEKQEVFTYTYNWIKRHI